MSSRVMNRSRRSGPRSGRGRGGRSQYSNNVRTNVQSAMPLYSCLPVTTRKFRFSNSHTNNTQYAISRGDLLGLWVIALNTTSAASCFGSVRLKQVNIFSAGNAGSLILSGIALEWVGEFSADNQVEAQGNADNLAVIKATPPLQSTAGFWQSASASDLTDVLFTVTLNQFDIIEVIVEWTPTSGSSAYLITSTGLTGGDGYYVHLDGPGGNLAPQGNINTI
jgi:ribosomal protein L15